MWEDNITGDYTSVGPQTDGTNLPADASITAAPVDAGGGAPASYSKDILDVFKYGVGAYTSQQNYKNMLDYKRYEATQTGLWAQGRPTVFSQSANGGAGGLVIMAAIVIGAVVLLQNRG